MSAFDLASLAQSGEATTALPSRSRRPTTNPFAAIVRKVADEDLNWTYPPVSTVADNGERSMADQMESGIRQAGSQLDRNDKASGGLGWKTILRKTPSDDGQSVSISFTVKRRSGGVVSDESGDAVAAPVTTPVDADETATASGRRRNR